MNDVTRRRTLALGLGLAVAACSGSSNGGGTISGPTPTPTPPPPTPTPTPTPTPSPSPTPTPTGTIMAAAAAKNMRFGSTFNATGSGGGSYQNPNYAALLELECQVVTPENELKMPQLRPNEATFSFTTPDAMLAYAESKGIAMRGHNFLWYKPDVLPGWVNTDAVLNGADAAAARARAEDIVRTHVQTVADHYGDRIKSWDVVNEAVDPATGTIRRDNVLARAVGYDASLLDLAFRTARAALPTAQLVYNDYADWNSPTHTAGVIALMQGFKDRGVPVDALGVQSHLSYYNRTATVAQILTQRQPVMKAYMDAITAMGYDIVITEMDVDDFDRHIGEGDSAIAVRDADNMALARGYLDVMLVYPQLTDVVLWGMVDRFSWLQGFNVRSDGLQKRPCPYDADYQPKGLRQTYIDAFEGTSARPA